MKKAGFLLLSLAWILLVSSNVFSEVIRTTKEPQFSEAFLDGGQTNIFYGAEYIFVQADREIARQELDMDGNIVEQEGQVPDGLVYEYYDIGAVRTKVNYLNNNPVGIESIYDQDNILLEERDWKAGKLDGLIKTYYKNGKVKTEINYKDGTREGISKHFYVSGSLAWEYDWRNGTYATFMKMYYENGVLSEETIYSDGKIINTKKYGEAGNLLWVRNY